MPSLDSFKTRTALTVGGETVHYYSLTALARAGFTGVERLPYSLKILLENLLRREDDAFVKGDDIRVLASWDLRAPGQKEISFMPARVLLQDFTGVPCVVDLAAMRDGIVALGGDPDKVNPLQPVELVIDHSVQVDHFGTGNAMAAQRRPRVSPQQGALRLPALGPDRLPQLPRGPPETGIVHQVNIEYLARVICRDEQDGGIVAYPDTVVRHRLAHDDGQRSGRRRVGRRRHRGRGGHARPAQLDADSTGPGYRLTGRLPEGATATDLVLTITEALRKKGVVGKFVEFYGPGLAHLDDCGPGDAGQHVPRVRCDRRDLPDRRDDARLPAAHRPRRRAGRARGGVRARPGAVPLEGSPTPSIPRVSSWISARWNRAWPDPRRPQDRVSLDACESIVRLRRSRI